MGPGEVYANPTVVLVALELRHPDAGPLSATAQAKLKNFLAARFPISRPVTINTVQAAPGMHLEMSSETSPRFMSRESTASVTFKNSAVMVETTRYSGYDDLRRLARLVVDARQEVGQIDGIERLGIRYINEVRAPNAGPDLATWDSWINPLLLGPATVGDAAKLGPAQLQALVKYQIAPASTLALRYGASEGYAVDPAGDLRRPTPPPTWFFLLDIDSFWTPTDGVPKFTPEGFIAECDRIHEPVRRVYESVITDRLREEVLHERER